MLIFLFVAALSTSAISAVFGMTGGMILMFALGSIYPIATAMVLHGMAQMISNFYRFWLLRAHVEWRVLPGYVLGMSLAALVALFLVFQPNHQLVNLRLGVLALLSLHPPIAKSLGLHRRGRSLFCGFAITSLQFIAGASGPLLHIFYVGSTSNQHSIIATKALTQTLSHGAKIIVYWFLALKLTNDPPTVNWLAASTLFMGVLIGTRIGKYLLDIFSHKDLPKITRHILCVMGLVFIAKGLMGS